MSEQFSEMQALQDMQDAQIGRSRAIQTKAAMAALNEPFCTEPEHAALQARAEAAERERDEANARIQTLEQQLREAMANWWEENTDREHLKLFPNARYWCHFCRQTGVFPDAIKHAPKCALAPSPAQPTEARE